MELDAYLAEQSQRGRWSGSVFVSRNGQTVLDTAYGIADRRTGRPNTPQTAYQIASVSKQFTAAAILLLQEQGQLSVQDHIAAWVRGCPRSGRSARNMGIDLANLQAIGKKRILR